MAIAFFPRTSEAGATLQFIIQPVQPQTQPPSSYPPGTTIVGQEIILGSVPARVWLELYVTGWGPDVLKTVQFAISATDPEQDGGGYAGTAAKCDGQTANGSSLAPAMQACRTNTDCRVLAGPACTLGLHSACVTYDSINANYFPAGKFCQPGYQNKCNPRWGPKDDIEDTLLSCANAVDLATLNFRFGWSCDPGVAPIDYNPSYVGTLVIDVPGNAKGTYTIDFDETQTFVQPARHLTADGQLPLLVDTVPIAAIKHAKITVLCGRCCYDLGGGDAQCVDHVSANECAAYGEGAVFAANEVCPKDGGAACPACGLDEHCDDGVFCNGVEVCEANGECGPGKFPCELWEECEESTDSCAPRIPAASNWGLVVLGLLIFIVAKLKRKPAETG